MLITDDASNNVAVLKIDSASGKLSATGKSMEMPHPVSATFVNP